MRHLLKACGIAAATVTALAVATPGAIAEENTYTFTCQGFGSGAHEPLGDREGHAPPYRITVVTRIWPVRRRRRVWHEHLGMGQDKRCLGHGQYISRKPGSIAVYAASEGKLALTVTDAKVTGFTASGRGTLRLVTGSAASLAGKSVTWTAKTSEPGRFKVEFKVE